MEFEESIYNLIPKEQYVAPKPKRHRSQYPADMAPTASTFGLGTTSKPICSNLAGKFNLEGGSHSHQAANATQGLPEGGAKPDTQTFRKKTTGNPILIEKSESKQSIPIFSTGRFVQWSKLRNTVRVLIPDEKHNRFLNFSCKI
jgi:hypothetical protein